MKKSVLYLSVFIVLFIIAFYFASKDDDEKIISRNQILLGTLVEIFVKTDNENSAHNSINEAFDEIRRIENKFSIYIENSQINSINKNKNEKIKIDDEIFSLLILCDSINAISKGGFDAALGNLISLWGFDTDSPKIPVYDSIKNILAVSGSRFYKISPPNTLNKLKKIKFDLGSILPGYAADRAIDILINNGIKKAMVNTGGEIKVIGEDWTVGIKDPHDKVNTVLQLSLTNQSLATSGSYENYFIKDEKVYHHILNPKTGYPENEISSITIISENAAFADALSTGLFNIGIDEGIELINSINKVDGVIISSKGEIYKSKNFNEFLIE